MHFRIEHRTHYCYSSPIFLEPHEVRLRPRGDWRQRLLAFDLTTMPEADGCAHNIDAEGNDVAQLWFSGQHSELVVAVSSEVFIADLNPFAFLLDPAFAHLPCVYTGQAAILLARYLVASAPCSVAELGRELVAQADGRLLPFLSELCQYIRENIQYEIRLEGDALLAVDTLSERRGACRDMALLFIEVCRSQGLAARFISGYQAGDLVTGQRYMHAWAEVYLPGGGWRGYDPSLGLAVSDRHLVLATAVRPADAQPIIGRFRGTVQTQMQVDLHIEFIE